MNAIEIRDLTKDYGHGRGVFDISLQVKPGECYGFLGPNGAGKTTTIRHLMGFSRPQSGTCLIDGKDTWKESASLQTNIGYLPGEIALPSGVTGSEFLEMERKMRKVEDDAYLKRLLDLFELDPNVDTKRMSLGTKRKLAVVTAFLHDPDILILDEPTSGLDPMMQQRFIQFLLEEKKRGKTIFLSSHIFSEVDACCDRIAVIKDGNIVSEFDPEVLKEESDKIFRLTFKNKQDYDAFVEEGFSFSSINPAKCRCRVRLKKEQMPKLIEAASRYDLEDYQEFPFTLEDYFMSFYREDDKGGPDGSKQ